MPCSSLTYNAKEIRLLLKEEADEVSKWTVEWIIIDPASFTGGDAHAHQWQAAADTLCPLTLHCRFCCASLCAASQLAASLACFPI